MLFIYIIDKKEMRMKNVEKVATEEMIWRVQRNMKILSPKCMRFQNIDSNF